MKTSIVKWLLIAVIGFLNVQDVSAHEYYVSVTTIHFNQESSKLEITLKLFTDDVERHIESQHDDLHLRLGSEREAPETDSLIVALVEQTIQLNIDQHLENMRFVGKEIELDLTWCYFEIVVNAPPAEIRMRNNILCESFPAQSNLVHFEFGTSTQTLTFDRYHAEQSIKF